MKNVGNRMNGLSLHYYTLPTGNWDKKGSGDRFAERRVVRHPPARPW
jgi:alpha-N-arabinofuranosidase